MSNADENEHDTPFDDDIAFYPTSAEDDLRPDEYIGMYLDNLRTAPYVVQDDVPLEDIHNWIDAIERHTGTMAAQLAEAERKVELAEWLSYQRTRHLGLRDEQIIGSLAYVPEWRDHDDLPVDDDGDLPTEADDERE